MARTIMELFNDQGAYKYGTNYSTVKSDTETLVEQETTGIRIKSLVEINNPLLYGNEAIRIANRTTKSVEDMKNSIGGESPDGGLIGKGISKLTGGKLNSISDVRDKVNSKLGIPANAIPTYVDGTGELQKGTEPNTMITLAKIKKDASGTELGKFLKQTGGGTPSTIGRAALGQGISLVKDKLRSALFGSPAGLGENEPTNGAFEYSSVNPYSATISIAKNTEPDEKKLQLPEINAKEKIDELKSKTKAILKKNKKIDEKEVDDEKPTDDKEPYSVKNQTFVIENSVETNLSIPTDEENDEVKQDTDNKLTEKKPIGEEQEREDYSDTNPYSNVIREERVNDETEGTFSRIDLSSLPGNVDREPTLSTFRTEVNSVYSSDRPYSKDRPNLSTIYGINRGSDELNQNGFESDETTRESLENLALVAVWIAPKGGKSVHFRSVISGIAETVTPSWSGTKFLGNPYQFYNYEGVERNVSFNLKMFCYSSKELSVMWKKIQFLTQNCYPSIEAVGKNKVAKPPIVEFRIGNMYKSKVAFIEQLSHTIPDDSNWETVDGVQLPKIVDVAITMKFIENQGIEDTLYSYEYSDEQIKIINEKRGAQGGSFSEEPQTDGSGTEGDTSETPPPVDAFGVEVTEEKAKQEDKSGINKAPKEERTGESFAEQQARAILARNTLREKIIDETRQKLLDQGIVTGELIEGIAQASVTQQPVNLDSIKSEADGWVSYEMQYHVGGPFGPASFQKMAAKSTETSYTTQDYDTWKRNRSGETTPPPSEESPIDTVSATPTNETESKKEKRKREKKERKQNRKNRRRNNY